MATFKAEIQNRRADGTYNVRIRITHNRAVRRLSTNLYITDKDLTRGGKIKNAQVLSQCEVLIGKCRTACNNMGYAINALSIDELADRVKMHLQGGERFGLDFIQYMVGLAGDMKPRTGSAYRSAANALRRFLKRDMLDISEISAKFLREFEAFLFKEPCQRGANKRKDADTKPPPKKGSAASKYLTVIRAAHNRAKEEYNDEDKGIVPIPFSPFKGFKIKPQPEARKRGLTPAVIQAIIDLPYTGRKSSLNLAKDCFILSFALIGMNSIDMYFADPVKGQILVYYRRKTADRRSDRAEMQVRTESCIDMLLERHQDAGGSRLFGFYKSYASPDSFNAAVNRGLKQIRDRLCLPQLDFYAARHSWATIARSADVGIDKATVHEALIHSSGRMAITDVYVIRDWSVIWEANRKVLSLFDWSAVGYDVL
jgi:hypothetical protein